MIPGWWQYQICGDKKGGNKARIMGNSKRDGLGLYV